ncbi:hypothetical protein ACJA88_009259 [Fusarium oxysporum]
MNDCQQSYDFSTYSTANIFQYFVPFEKQYLARIIQMPQSHLEIFNPGTDVVGLPSFTQFSSLPAEIRVSIWTWSLRHQRIIKIFLRLHASLCVNRTRKGIHSPSLKPGEDGPPYYPVVDGRQLLSKLLRVNAESRQVALSFHRVHLPCWLTVGESKHRLTPWTSGTVHYNPEYDFFHIKQDTKAIIDFVCDLKTKYDPRNIGLRNLALGRDQLGGRPTGLDAIGPLEITAAKVRTFKEIISELNEVWLVSIQECTRQMIGDETGWPTIHKRFLDRSFPIHATPHSFDRIGPDPRTIENCLSHLHVHDPKRLYDSWLQVLERIGVKPCEERYRLLLAFRPGHNICKLRDAEDWLQREESRWIAKPDSRRPSYEQEIESVAASETPEIRDEDLSKAVRPAFGFWLFPVDAFSDENDSAEPQDTSDSFDVRKHWPELVLLRLNGGETDRNVSREVEAHHSIAFEPRLRGLPMRKKITSNVGRVRRPRPSYTTEDVSQES